MDEPIKLVEIVTEALGTPRNDGSPGSALYEVPIQLSRTPSSPWAHLFVQTWDRPPQFTSRHRPGICEIVGDRIILTRTTIEEVRDTHIHTLKSVLDVVNKQVAETERDRAARQQELLQKTDEEKQRRIDAAKQVKF